MTDSKGLLGGRALAMLHQYVRYEGMNPSQMFNKSLLRLLTQKCYAEDLLYPVDERRCVMDHLPNLMAHLRVYSESLPTTPRQAKTLNAQFDEIDAKLKQQAERVLQERRRLREPRAPSVAGPRPDVL